MNRRPLRLRAQLVLQLSFGVAAVWALLALHYQQSISNLLRQDTEARIGALVQQLAASSVLGALASSPDMLVDSLDSALAQADVLAVGVYAPEGTAIATRLRAG